MNSRLLNNNNDTCHHRRLFCFFMMFVLQLQLLRNRAAARSLSSSFSSAAFATRHSYSKNSLFQKQQQQQLQQVALYSTAHDHEAELLESGYNRPPVQWYPGHIAKAERQLSETLKAVDVVIEVRDARACKATAHPRVGEWCAGRPRIVVLTHLDMTPKSAVRAWQNAYDVLGAERWDDAPINAQVANQAKQARNIRFQYDKKDGSVPQKISVNNNNQGGDKISPVEQVLFVNAKQGQGIHMLTRAVFKAGAHVQERRERRGLNPRALRVGIIGYPNVGKSALINRLLGRKRARTANTPGITRTLQWIRVRTDENKKAGSKKEFELLDSPGIIPAKMVDQSDALLLAACNCIGQAAYDNQAVAAYLCEWLKAIHVMGKQHANAPEWREKCNVRYGFDPLAVGEDGNQMTGEDILFEVADRKCKGSAEDASRMILQDFRTGRMGLISLQVAPETEEDEGQLQVPIGKAANAQLAKQRREELEREQQERARMAVETAKERGLELPPMVTENQDNADKMTDDVGKGMFDGW